MSIAFYLRHAKTLDFYWKTIILDIRKALNSVHPFIMEETIYGFQKTDGDRSARI